MSRAKMEHQALDLLAAFEQAGKTVRRVTIEGRRIEIELNNGDDRDDFDRIEMRHDKT